MTSQDLPQSDAESIFAAWLGHHESGDQLDLEALCKEHPEHEARLRELYAHWKGLEHVLSQWEAGGSLSERLESKYGSGVDPQVSLSLDTSEPVRGDYSTEVLSRLAGRGPASTRYRLEGEIAHGGMGAVLGVWDEDLRRHLAMKVMLGKGATAGTGDTPPIDPKMLSRFLEEAQVTGQLDHPGIVPVHELGLDPEGRVYFTMKLVRGETLGSIFEKVRSAEEGWTQTRALGVLLKVCEAMSYAHSKRVIHRDLKPANIMVGRFGEVYVMDWGLARVLGTQDKKDIRVRQAAGASLSKVRTDRRESSSDDSPLITMDGDVVGTPAYMSPEQAKGDLAAMGPASDVYALGAILYHLLVGHMPYAPPGSRLNAYAIWGMVQNGPPVRLDTEAQGAPVELVAVCEKAMARDPSDRYRDMGAMAEDLRAFVEGRVVKAHRTGAVVEFRKWVARNRALAAAVLLVLILAIGGSTTSSIVLAAKNETIRQARDDADDARDDAIVAKDEALAARDLAHEKESKALITQSLFLADLANQQTESGDAATGLLLALEALPRDLGNPDRPYVLQAEGALLEAFCALRECAVLRGHEGLVLNATFSPDGNRVVTASWDGTARLWDSEGKEIVVLNRHEKAVFYSAFNPDGSRILTASHDGTARLWDAEGKEIAILHGYGNDVSSAIFSPDGSRIVTTSVFSVRNVPTESSRLYGSEAAAQLWDAEGNKITDLGGHEGTVGHATFSPDSRRFVTASWDNNARLYDAEGKKTAVLHGHEGGVRHAAFSPDGSRIVTASYDDTARLWDAEGNKIIALRGHEGDVLHAAFSPDGSRVVTASADKTARLWDLGGKQIAVLRGHESGVEHVAFSSDGALIVTTSKDNTARLWEPRNNKITLLGGHEAKVHHAAFSPDGGRIVTASFDDTARLWNVKSGITVLQGHKDRVYHAAISSDGSRIVTSSRDNTARLWDTDGVEITSLDGHEGDVSHAAFSPDGNRIVTASRDGTARLWDTEGSEIALLLSHEGDIDHVAFSPDGGSIVTASYDGTARLWDAEGKKMAVLSGHGDAINSATFSPDGTRVVTASADNTARLWDLEGNEIAVLAGHKWTVNNATFSPDGRRIVTASGFTARLWDLEGNEIAVLAGHERTVNNATFSPDGSLVVTASGDDTARLWNNQGDQIVVLRGHKTSVDDAAFSPDGRRIVTASGFTVRLWDLKGTEIAVLCDHKGLVNHVAFSPDGSYIVTSSNDRTARLFPFGEALIIRARNAAPRDLTPRQRKAFFLDRGQ